MASSYIEPMDLAALCWTALCILPRFAFFALFATALSPAASLARLHPLVVLYMENVSPTAYLSVLIGILLADLAAIPSLHWQRKFLGWDKLRRHRQAWIVILKYAFDSALVILMVLYTSKRVDDGKKKLA